VGAGERLPLLMKKVPKFLIRALFFRIYLAKIKKNKEDKKERTEQNKMLEEEDSFMLLTLN